MRRIIFTLLLIFLVFTLWIIPDSRAIIESVSLVEVVMTDQKVSSLKTIGERLQQIAPAGKAIFSASPVFLEGLKAAHAGGHSPSCSGAQS